MPEVNQIALPTRFAETVTDWQKRLLQLDRRNNLLYFKPGKSAVRILDRSPNEILEPLQSRRGLTFDYAEPRSRNVRSSDFESSEETNSEPYVLSGDLRADCAPLELQRRLGKLRRRDREWEEEQGLNVLFLAIGFLDWIDESGGLAMAPLLLVPCDLERPSARDHFYLKQDDEELSTNTTLAAKLKEFGIELPESDSWEDDPESYLAGIRRIISGRPGWQVTEDMYLATFAYSKLAMWRDLETIKNRGTQHPIVLGLAGAAPGETAPADATPSARTTSLPIEEPGARLDDVLAVRDQYCVLPADYSQLVAITKARAGSHLVIHGPPGTGKSQTIANIITTLLAEGKTVLFVSQKTAALDIVKRRLEEKELGPFCLDLHSERGSKANVYRQLQESAQVSRRLPQVAFDYEALSHVRQELNIFVRALHELRQPLGRSVFQVSGRFAQLRDKPHVALDLANMARELDLGHLDKVLQAADRLRVRPREFVGHWTSHWRALKRDAASLDLANNIRRDMQTLEEAVNLLRPAASGIARSLGLPEPVNFDQVVRLEALARHLDGAPGIPVAWIQEGDTPRLRDIARREAERVSTREALLKQLNQVFEGINRDLDFARLAEQLVVSPEEQQLLEILFGQEWAEHILEGCGSVSKSLRQVECTLASVMSFDAIVQERLNYTSDPLWTTVSRSLAIAETLARVAPVHPKWAEIGGTQFIAEVLNEAQRLITTLEELEKGLFSEFEPDILELCTPELLARYRTAHQSVLRRFMGPTYRSDRDALRSLYRKGDKLLFQQEVKAVETAIQIKRDRARWTDAAEQLADLCQRGFAGRTTDWDAAAEHVRDVEKLIEDWPGSRTDCASFLADAGCASRCREVACEFQVALDNARTAIDSCLSAQAAGAIYEGTTKLSSLQEAVHRAAVIVQRIETASSSAVVRARRPIYDLESLRNFLLSGAQLAALELEHSMVRDSLQLSFGERFRDLETDWDQVLACISWAERLLTMLPATEISVQVLRRATEPQRLSEDRATADRLSNVVQQYGERIALLRESYDLSGVPWESWESASFDELRQWARDLVLDADFAGDWLAYQTAAEELDRLVGLGATDRIREHTEDSEMIPSLVERSILSAWLDWTYSREPKLAQFASSDHENLIARFKDLDQRLAGAARDQVRRTVLQGYPDLRATGAVGILRGELTKQRRRWPVRKLLKTIPKLIQAYKPCFLVSPLAVSQYLPLSGGASEEVQFDCVIFDEASQVFPEEAIPAILRGKQVIVAGDRKQLPPSSFWMQSLAEDEADNGDEVENGEYNQLVDRESILDVGVGLHLFDESWLNTHYRSRDETLIRFSNHSFYADQLLVFPSPGINDLWYGVHDVYVSDGRYDAGATRTNRKEAERVVELVFSHMRTRPFTESLGVVALSRPQADLIERLIDERRLLERDVDQSFDDKSTEPFFVKNLENVQGDERDRIIISVGYGPTVGSGAVPNRFGPLNIAGGERRLNVVVTRARLRVDLVHSLQPADIHSQQIGARHLRRYLEYVANPCQAFEGEVTIDPASESESPFEEAVNRMLVARGFRTARQVGVAGYRIDLAILSENGSKYDLGIECDGWTYHNTPAARDRDWLRQQVLEGLGWKIHRVWSTAWVKNPQAEFARIEASLAEAQSSAPTAMLLEAQAASPGPARIHPSDEEPDPIEGMSSSPDAIAKPPSAEPATLARVPGSKVSDLWAPELRLIRETGSEAEKALATEELLYRGKPLEGPSNPLRPQIERPLRPRSAPPGSPPVSSPESLEVRSMGLEALPRPAADIQLEEYAHARLLMPSRNAELKYEPIEKLARLIVQIAEVEGPVHKEVVFERIRVCYRVGRIRNFVRERLEEAIQLARRSTLLLAEADFLLVRVDQLQRDPRKPVDGNIKHVPPNELGAVILHIARVSFGIARLELISEAAKSLGFDRTGHRIHHVLDGVIEELLEQGKLLASADMLRVAE